MDLCLERSSVASCGVHCMTLILNNADVAKVLTIETTLDALEESYRNLAIGEATCRPRIDIRIPTMTPPKNYQWGSMEGGSTGGYFAVRMKSDVVFETSYNGAVTQEKYLHAAGTLSAASSSSPRSETGEPLALIHDGVLQHMRVAGDGGIGVKYMAKQNAAVVGMLGSGGMARRHMDAFMHVRPSIRKLQVYSPTKANREAFGREVAAKHGIDVQVCERPEQIYAGADIVASLTDSAVALLDGSAARAGRAYRLHRGQRDCRMRPRVRDGVDVYLRFGDAPAPVEPARSRRRRRVASPGTARSGQPASSAARRRNRDRTALGVALAGRSASALAELVSRQGQTGPHVGRDQITWSERGNLQGAQFYAVAGKVYELARAAKLGYELPTEMLLQDIRD